MTRELTQAQKDILNFVKNFLETNGFPPTRKEIAKHMGYRSSNAAQEHLEALERKGVVKLIKDVSRGIQLVSEKPMESQEELSAVPSI